MNRITPLQHNDVAREDGGPMGLMLRGRDVCLVWLWWYWKASLCSLLRMILVNYWVYKTFGFLLYIHPLWAMSSVFSCSSSLSFRFIFVSSKDFFLCAYLDRFWCVNFDSQAHLFLLVNPTFYTCFHGQPQQHIFYHLKFENDKYL